MNSLLEANERILQHLLQLRETDKNLFFVPRRKNNDNRLENGYWFIGNDKYLHLSFWLASDRKEKKHSLAYVVHSNGKCKVELSAQDSKIKAKYFEKLAKEIGEFKKNKSKNIWLNFYPNGTNYIENLNHFITKVKPVIDRFVENEKPEGIYMVDEKDFKENLAKIMTIREKQDLGIYSDLFGDLEKKTAKGGTEQKNTDEVLVSYSGRYRRRAKHNTMQQNFYEHLIAQFGKENVKMEENFVDLIVRSETGTELIEVKPYKSVTLCIREGLGQLLSYYHKHYLEVKNISLKIIGAKEADENELAFIEFIKNSLTIKFEYEAWIEKEVIERKKSRG